MTALYRHFDEHGALLYVGISVNAALSVKDDAVRKALKSGVLPASWYNTLEKLAGRPLPRRAFSFKGMQE